VLSNLDSELKIQVGIFDDDPLRLIGYRALLDCEPDIQIASFAKDLQTSDQRVDVFILSHTRGASIGWQIENLKAIAAEARVLVAGRLLTDAEIVDAISSGAKGYYCETAASSELAGAIRAVHRGVIWAPRRLVAEVITQIQQSMPSCRIRQRAHLTDREKEVLRMLVAGKSNKEIAGPLGIELRTVKAHVSHIMHKLGVKNRIGASIHAVQQLMVQI
jgi:DNA-binding NarL/FixJ family response regulator